MELFFRKKNKTIIIFISGEIDHHSVKDIRRYIENIFSETHIRNIIFNFEEVTFMDSSGIGMLIGRYKELRSVKGRIAIVGASSKIKEIIFLSGLTNIIPLFITQEEAIDYVERREESAL